MAGVALLDLDPDLGAGLRPEEAAAASRLIKVRQARVGAGAWEPARLWPRVPEAVGLIVVDGLIAREIVLCDRPARHLLGVGDPVLPSAGPGGLLAPAERWTVLEPARFAVLERQWVEATARWPVLGSALVQRVAEQADRLAVHQAISQLPRVEDRVLNLFLHLAERWGRITPSGPLLRLDLTHDEIGRLLGARRPTVSLALAELSRAGLVERRPDGWLIASAAVPEAVRAAPEPARRRRPVSSPQGSASVSDGAVSRDALRARLDAARTRFTQERGQNLLLLRRVAQTRRRSLTARERSRMLRERSAGGS